ncbi:hypothetical protein ACGFNU_34575 [Spirillospora sp. NPDC048911]|uniref:hypothetical protein n=1 Tax=Spirillospora sp. NPDC048911 TaxID=3364527 RepID=UPI00372311EF
MTHNCSRVSLTGLAFGVALLVLAPAAVADAPPCTDTSTLLPLAAPIGAGGVPTSPWNTPACPGTPGDTEPIPGQ